MTKQFLIIGPAWVGDMVMAQTLFKLLKQRENCEIDVLAPSWSKPLLQRMPEVRTALTLAVEHKELKLIDRYTIGKQLREKNYQHAILLPNSIKSALVPFWAKIPLRTGWVGEYRYGLLNDIRKLDKNLYPLMIQRFMALGLPKHFPLNTYQTDIYQTIKPKLLIDIDTANQTAINFQLDPSAKKVLALCPGAEFGPAKRWPEQHYAVLANQKLAEGWQVWLFGSVNDKASTALINEATNHRCIDLAGKTNLAEAIDLLSFADMVVSNDSGLMHISAALERKLVVVYGSSSPKFTPPLNDNKRIVKLDLACSPCFKRSCKFKHFNCLNLLEPKQVNIAIDELMQS